MAFQDLNDVHKSVMDQMKFFLTSEEKSSIRCLSLVLQMAAEFFNKEFDPISAEEKEKVAEIKEAQSQAIEYLSQLTKVKIRLKPTDDIDRQSVTDDHLSEEDKDLKNQLRLSTLIRKSGKSKTFDDVAGMDEAKGLLREAVIYPRLMPNFYKSFQPWKGILMFGPPGTGKTLLATAVANMSECSFFVVKPSTIATKYFGEGEKSVKFLFELARDYAPSILFIDEIDSMCGQRSGKEHDCIKKVKTEFLQQVDSAAEMKGVTVLGATNFPWDIDEAMRRRLEKRIFIPLPDASTREELLKMTLEDLGGVDPTVNLQEISNKLHGYSAADIAIVCRDARMGQMRIATNPTMSNDEIKNLDKTLCKTLVTLADLHKSIAKIKPSVNAELLHKHEEWKAEFGSA